MTSAQSDIKQFVINASRETWENEDEETCGIVIGPKVPEAELDSLGLSLPAEYISFVTEVGLCHFESQEEDCEPDRFCRMLSPDEIATIRGYFREWTSEHDEYEEGDEERAAVQQRIRDELIPFQYHGDGTSTDVYCFVPSHQKDGNMQVIIAYHDDDELHLWFELPDEKKIWGLGAHLERWVEEMRSPD